MRPQRVGYPVKLQADVYNISLSRVVAGSNKAGVGLLGATPHGTARAYHKGCRCYGCCDARRAYYKKR